MGRVSRRRNPPSWCIGVGGLRYSYLGLRSWHRTNAMGQADQDFEKGEADGTLDAMQILEDLVQT